MSSEGFNTLDLEEAKLDERGDGPWQLSSTGPHDVAGRDFRRAFTGFGINLEIVGHQWISYGSTSTNKCKCLGWNSAFYQFWGRKWFGAPRRFSRLIFCSLVIRHPLHRFSGQSLRRVTPGFDLPIGQLEVFHDLLCDRVLLLVGATALRTSDWEIPKCRAIRDGVTPALKAARTALIFAWVNETATAFTRRRGEASADIAGFPPRRSCSRSTAAGNRSSSRS
jgi:hypothetical protein